MSEIAHTSGEMSARLAVAEKLVDFAYRKGRGDNETESVSVHEANISTLLEAVATVSRSSCEADGWAMFGSLVVRVAAAWPDSTRLVCEALEALLTVIHPENAEHLWNAWVELRARR